MLMTAMTAFQTLGHINLMVRDVEASTRFYEKFGFKPFLQLTEEDHTPWIVYLRLDDMTYLELMRGGTGRAPGRNMAGVHHFCITVSDIEQAVAQLEAGGIKLPKPLSLKRNADKNRGTMLEDPDGNLIELMEMSPDCIQYEAIKAFKAGEGRTSIVHPTASST